jgi:hypothetical protein
MKQFIKIATPRQIPAAARFVALQQQNAPLVLDIMQSARA